MFINTFVITRRFPSRDEKSCVSSRGIISNHFNVNYKLGKKVNKYYGKKHNFTDLYPPLFPTD